MRVNFDDISQLPGMSGYSVAPEPAVHQEAESAAAGVPLKQNSPPAPQVDATSGGKLMPVALKVAGKFGKTDFLYYLCRRKVEN